MLHKKNVSESKFILKSNNNNNNMSSSSRQPSSSSPVSADYVKLNVGGKIFCTTRNTLTKDPNSLLSRMLHYGVGGGFALEDEHGDYFIDRNPRCFEYILDYLRDGEFFCRRPEDFHALLREANYYQLAGLAKRVEVEMLENQRTTQQQNYSGNNNNSSNNSNVNARTQLGRGASTSQLLSHGAGGGGGGGAGATPPSSVPSSSASLAAPSSSSSSNQQQQQQQNAQSGGSDITLLTAQQSVEFLRRIDDSCRRIWSFCSRILVGQDGYLHVKRY